MASTIVRSRRKAKTPVEEAAELLAEYAPLVSQVNALKTPIERLKNRLTSLLLEGGTLDEKKSRWIELPAPVEGIRAIKHERRVSKYIDEALARKTLARRARAAKDDGLVSRCLQTTVVIGGSEQDVLAALEKAGVKVTSASEQLDQDAVMAEYARGNVKATDVDAMTIETETYAFKLISATPATTA